MYEYDMQQIAKDLEKVGLTRKGSMEQVMECLEKHFDGQIYMGWSYEDVLYQADCMGEGGKIKSDSWLTEQDARDILDEMFDNHDASIGINWDVIDVYVSEYKREKEVSDE